MAEKDTERTQRPAHGPGSGGPGGRFSRKQEKPKDLKKSVSRLLGYLSASRPLLIALLVFVVASTLFHLWSNVLVKDVIAALGSYDVDQEKFTVDPNQAKFALSLGLLLLSYVLYCVLQYFSSRFSALLANRTVRKMRADLFGRLVYLPIGYTDSHAHGDLMSRMTNDVQSVQQAISQSLNSLVSGILTVLGCLGIMIWYSPLLTLISFLLLGLTLLVSRFMSKYMRPLFSKQQSILGALNSQTEENVTGYKTVKAYHREQKALADFAAASDSYTKTAIRAQIMGGAMGPVMNFIGNIGYFLVCIVGSLALLYLTKIPFFRAVSGSLSGAPLSVAVVVMFLTTTKQFTRPLNEIAQLYSSLITALAGAERVFAVLDEQPEDFSKQEDFDVSAVRGELDFEHVDFSYEKGKPVLRDFCLHAEPGHKIALVGATGSGKTTIVNLLLRFYDIDSGTIRIDGQDISRLSKNELRKAISIVLQDPVLFADTIENNIRYGREDATDEQIDAALRFANCESFLRRLKDGKKTELTEGATNISQGQRQLLTIARAVIAEPKILILDEATSSVDTRTEKKIQDAMVKLMQNRTSIIIAHRLSTIQDADRIVVLDAGRVVEMGSHSELLALNGVYRKLYDTQFKGIAT